MTKKNTVGEVFIYLYGFDAVLILIQFNMLKSACMLGHLRTYSIWQTSKVNHIATVKHMTINNC